MARDGDSGPWAVTIGAFMLAFAAGLYSTFEVLTVDTPTLGQAIIRISPLRRTLLALVALAAVLLSVWARITWNRHTRRTTHALTLVAVGIGLLWLARPVTRGMGVYVLAAALLLGGGALLGRPHQQTEGSTS